MKKLAIGTFMLLAGALAATAQASLFQQLAVVKITDTEVVTVKEVKDIVDTQEKEAGRKLTPQEREQTLETVINQKLIMQAAKRPTLRPQPRKSTRLSWPTFRSSLT